MLVPLAFAAGCGGGGKDAASKPRQPVVGKAGGDAKAAQGLGFPGFATKNTTRVGGADPIADAAGVAQAIYPSRSRDTRPGAVTLVDGKDWRAAISAAQLMSRPLRAPILLSDGDKLPDVTQSALDDLGPTGAEKAGKAQVIRIGKTAKPDGLRSSDVAGVDPSELAQAIDRLHTAAAGAPTRSVLVAPSSAPEFAMPAAAWAAKAGDPVLWSDRDRLPAATKAAINAHKRPRIYVLGPASVISDRVLKALGDLGTTRRISGPDPVANAIAFARFSDGRFGWNAVDPGHGLVFATTKRPGDAPAAAALSGAGTYGPLLLVTEPNALPAPVQDYLLDIQPGYDKDPVRGVYNHGWVVGDEAAISIDVQSRIDALLEIQPVQPSS
ncbi:MAG: cell wall-binding repeat-containing protein [Solirubrobacteraceae bacterium]